MQKLLLLSFFCCFQLLSGQTPDFKNLPEEEVFELAAAYRAADNYTDYQAAVMSLHLRIKPTKGVLPDSNYLNNLANLAWVTNLLGDATSAEKYYEEAIAGGKVFYGENDPSYILNLASYGNFLSLKGDFERAEKVLQDAITLSERNESAFANVPHANEALISLGYNYIDATRYPEAIPIFLQVKSRYQEAGLDSIQAYANILSGLAYIYLNTSQYKRALEIGRESVSTAVKHRGKDNPTYGQLLNNLAITYKRVGDIKTADSLYTISVENFRKYYGEDHLNFIITQENKAKAMIALGQRKDGLVLMEDCYKFMEGNLPLYHFRRLTALEHFSGTLTEEGRGEEAGQLLEMVFHTDSLAKNPVYKKLALAILDEQGFVLERYGKAQLTKWYYLNLAKREITRVTREYPFLSEEQQLKYAAARQDIPARIASYAARHPENAELTIASYQLALQFKGLLLENKLKRLEIIRAGVSPELNRKYDTWLALRRQLAGAYAQRPDRQPPGLPEAEAEAEKLAEELALGSASFRILQQKNDWQDIQEALPDDGILIDISALPYFNLGQRKQTESIQYVAYLLKKGWEHPILVPLFLSTELPDLRRIRELYRFQPQDRNALYNLVWKPLQPYLEGTEELYYSPDGALHRINLSAIPVNDQHTIGNRFNIHQLGRADQVLPSLQTPIASISSALLLGGVNYDQVNKNAARNTPPVGGSRMETGSSDWDFLKWTGAEVDTIGHLLTAPDRSINIYRGEYAREELIKNDFAGNRAPDVLHLATHAYFFSKAKANAPIGFKASEHPLIRSGLILAGANQVWLGGEESPGQEDGVLTAYEIAQLDLRNTKLVVLSACNTGLGDIENGEGVYGLQRAFKAAGVRYVLMSLWNVKDEQTYDFMSLFYTNWQRQKMTIPAAYHATQQALKERYSQPFDPQSWAGFILQE